MTSRRELPCVYTLEGPDGVVRYIGMTCYPSQRLQGHRFCHSKRTPVGRWLREMRDSRQVVTVRIVFRHAQKKVVWEQEQRRIQSAWDAKAPIFNRPPKRAGRAPWVLIDTTTRVGRKQVLA